MGRRARRTSARRGWDGQAVIGEPQGVRQPGANRVVSDAAWRYRPIVFDTVRYSTVFRASIGARDAPGCRIFIGAENRMFALSGSSVIAAPYRGANGEVVGVVGVIGPTRLNYARVVPMVDFTAKALTRLMA